MRRGFTLVELSIVLVIIGLLIGGILVGQSMMDTAKISAQVRQIQQFDAAVNNFLTKYGQLPGDSTVLAGGCSYGAHCNNGLIEDDSIINWNFVVVAFTYETAAFWPQLGQSGFMSDTTTFTPNVSPATGFDITSANKNSPRAEIDKQTGIIAAEGEIWAPDYGGKNVYQLGDYHKLGVGGDMTIQTNMTASITPVQALAIDTKMDDGKADSGSVQPTWIDPVNSNQFGWPGDANCATGSKYLSTTTKSCALVIKMLSQSSN